MIKVPFNKPYMTGKELWYISQAHHNCQLSGDGPFTKKCHEWLEMQTECQKALLTHSCTAALEMAAILADIQPGDEIIMPSYTFVTTANAFVLRGGVPVFVDIRKDTLNIDESRIEEAITDKTVAIVAVHYAGVGCEMDTIMEIARRRNLLVIEDAAQGLMASYKGRALGSIGHMGTLSFHETKNITSGEGGALLINDERFVERAEIIREKGTNRSRFFRGEVDKYSWVDIGSSYLPGELIAAFLYAQLEEATDITNRRMAIWCQYHKEFTKTADRASCQLPIVPEYCVHNAHMYYILFRDLKYRTDFIAAMNEKEINTVFHYIPLHSSPAGQHYCRTSGSMAVTEAVSESLVRLPLWIDMDQDIIDYVINQVKAFLGQ
jgi:dTDP-4-amino-4,6-dideoxygalactose transaminase